MKDYEPGLAMPAGETGTIGRSASILIQSGFNSRLAGIKAVNDSGRGSLFKSCAFASVSCQLAQR